MKNFASAMNTWDSYRDSVLLFVRVALCFMFVFVHGGPKLFGGPEKWQGVGSMLAVIGVTAMPTVLGFIAAFFEFVGGVLIGLGLFTRLGAAMILSTLIIASVVMFAMKGLFAAAAPIEDSLFMLVLMVVGAGKYSFDYRWFGK
jgi:putative oxidoreductase